MKNGLDSENLSRMTVCFLLRQLNDGGAQRQLCELVKVLDKSRFRVVVVAFYDGGRFKAEVERIHDVELVIIGKRHTYDVAGAFLRLVREMRRIRPDVLHGYLDLANIFAILLKPFLSKTPKTRIIWGLRNSGAQHKKDTRAGLVLAALERKLARFPDRYIANSVAGRDYYVSLGYRADRCVVIPNGIDTETFAPDALARTEMRASWGIAPETPLVGIVGRIAPQKDHPTFLRAAAEVARAREDVRFVVVGGGEESYVTEMKALADLLGIAEKVVWTGSLGEMPRVFNALDLLVLTSYREGFPNVVGEAMSCGVPCVVTRAGDAEIIVGELGTVCEIGDAPAVASGILNELAKERREVGQSLRASIESRFSTEALRRKTEDILCRTA